MVDTTIINYGPFSIVILILNRIYSSVAAREITEIVLAYATNTPISFSKDISGSLPVAHQWNPPGG